MYSSQIHFYDAATPQNVPSGVYAAVYINGFAWPQSQIDRMHRVIRVSVHPEAFWAKYARVLDIETGAAGVANLVPFVHERLAHGFHDATAYVNRSNILACHQEMERERERLHDPDFTCRYWVATLDGNQGPDFDGLRAWAVQYYGGMRAAYDLSVLHGVNDFARP